MDDLKEVVTEWVLTNGKLPGFAERLTATLPKWSIVGPEGMVVFRGQGGDRIQKSGDAQTNEIEPAVRPVLAASKTPYSVPKYTGKDCCVFKITLKPGIRYIDVNALLVFREPIGLGKRVLGVKNSVIESILQRCNSSGPGWNSTTPPIVARKAILERCIGNHEIMSDGRLNFKVLPENEIMIDGLQGVFLNKKPICPMILEMVTYTVDYVPRDEGLAVGAGAGAHGGRLRSRRRRYRRNRTYRRR